MVRHSQALSLPSNLEAANVLIAGRYRVLGRLGKGGAGSVYRVMDASTDRELALKRLSATASKQLHALFEREYYTLSTLKHPNVVEVYEYGNYENSPYYTMELLSGSDLSDHAPMPWKVACQVLTQAASALAPLHSRRLIHRDVSPRNLWRTPNGDIKLIDFGALTPFGTPGDIVGTPPFVAPEAMHGQGLDQRADLYALGGLLYWLVTGVHAFPARALRDLPALWSAPFVSASRRLAGLNRADLPELPAHFDALVEALLSRDPKARPASTGEVIDRLRALAGLSRDARPEQAQLFLQQAAFVGREREQRHFQRRMQLSAAGMGGCTVIEARSGEGRTRTLSELAVHARVAGAVVLSVDAQQCEGVHGVALALAQKMLDVLPEIARAAALPHIEALSSLSPKLAERLATQGSPALTAASGELRARAPEALTEWFCELSKNQPLLLLVDDVQRADEASMAWLLTLSIAAERHRMMMVVAYNSDGKQATSAAFKKLLQQGRRVLLRPLDGSAVRELLGSLFGQVPNLVRLAERLHRASRGNPAHVLELAQHLVRQEVVTHVDGTWVLPQDIPDGLLSFSRGDALASRLSSLSDMARIAARILSVRQGFLSLPMCLALTDLEPRQLYPALSGLVTEGVLIGADEGYRFSDEATRLALYAELSLSSQRAARGRLGKLLLAGEQLSRLEELEAHLLLLDLDANTESAARVSQLATALVTLEPDNVGAAAPLVVQAYKAFKAQGRSGYELMRLLAALAIAGYFSDRKLLSRYAHKAVKTLSASLAVPLMRRLSPWLGNRLSFHIGNFVARRRFRRYKHNKCVPSHEETRGLFFSLLTSLAGASTIQVDPVMVREYAAMLRPWTAPGKKTPALTMHEFITNLAATVEDHTGAAVANWQRMIPRLRDPAQNPGLPDASRLRFLGGALYACATLEARSDGPAALRMAEELEQFPIKFYRMSADQIRTLYYSNQGNLELFDHFRRRSELHAIQRGTAWQTELWSPSASITVFLRNGDALGMKESIEQVQRIVKDVPSFSTLLERARGAYLLVRRHYAEAVPVLERCLLEKPGGVLGWAHAHGALARALNALGEYARAKAVCETALDHLQPEDRRFAAMNLAPQIEYRVAQAGLGEHAEAVQGLDELLAKHGAAQGPLTMGAIHEACVKAAMIRGDEAACRAHLAEMEKFYRGTDVPSLIAVCENVAKDARRHFAENPEGATALDGTYVPPVSTSTSTGVTLIEHELTQATSLPDFGQRALRVLTDGVPEPRAELWVLNGEQIEPVARVADGLPSEVAAWARERCSATLADDVTQTAMGGDTLGGNPDVFSIEGYTYRLSILRGAYSEQGLDGVAIVGSSDSAMATPNPHIVEAIGRRLKVQIKTTRTSIASLTIS